MHTGSQSIFPEPKGQVLLWDGQFQWLFFTALWSAEENFSGDTELIKN